MKKSITPIRQKYLLRKRGEDKGINKVAMFIQTACTIFALWTGIILVLFAIYGA